jgi:hypothetical protein
MIALEEEESTMSDHAHPEVLVSTPWCQFESLLTRSGIEPGTTIGELRRILD